MTSKANAHNEYPDLYLACSKVGPCRDFVSDQIKHTSDMKMSPLTCARLLYDSGQEQIYAYFGKQNLGTFSVRNPMKALIIPTDQRYDSPNPDPTPPP